MALDRFLTLILYYSTMTNHSYKEALNTARAQRAELLNERAQIDQKILKLNKIVESLTPLCEDEPQEVILMTPDLSTYKFADACRIVLRTSGQFLAPTTVRDILIREGYDVSSQKNALASVHAILKRMKDAGEAEEQTVEGKTVYRYTSARPITGFSGIPTKPEDAMTAFKKLLGSAQMTPEEALNGFQKLIASANKKD